ncbi:MAG: Holliday junction resolvase RuvX [Actinomycetota bacterium]|nr:Holliday junction resolvase RuvX [Actinomycetota bacterium]
MILGIDPGRRRVGVAVADEVTRFARPVEVIDTRALDPVARIADLVVQLQATAVVVGLPVALSGAEGPAASEQRDFMSRLSEVLAVDVIPYDERLTTVVAERALRDAGTKSRKLKGLRDAVAAQVLLQDYLDATAAAQ